MIECQCFVCKQGIAKQYDLDPCGITIFSNCDKSLNEQKEQTFYCHYECFRKINNDDSILYLEDLSTPKEAEEEFRDITEKLWEFADTILYKTNDKSIISELLLCEKGKWYNLFDYLKRNSDLKLQLKQIVDLVGSNIMISKLDVISTENRNKAVFAISDKYYDYTIMKEFREKVNNIE